MQPPRDRARPSANSVNGMRLVVVALISASCATPAAAVEAPSGPPAGITCEDVRAKVAELGRIKALAMAIQMGATWKQIAAARRCLALK
jgi:hypothetical protein